MIATKTIPLMVPYVPRGTIEAVSAVLRTRWIGQGPKTDEFERQFSRQIVGGRCSVAVGSGTDALHLAYLLAGVGPGDEVIAPVFTCTATNLPLLYCGAKIRFCDVAPNSLNMGAEQVRALLTEKTKAIAVVHYGGMRVAQELFSLGVTHGIPVIEDAAQALGAYKVGQLGTFACFSFQAVKHVTTGDGGMLVLSPHLDAKARRMRWFGIDRQAKLAGRWENDITEIGYKYQMTDIGAAMGLAGLESLDWQIVRRRAMRDRYAARLHGVDGIRWLDDDPQSACWLGTVLVDRREDFRRKLLSEGIESDPVHYRNDRYTIFAQSRGQFPNMDAIDSKYLCIPLHMGMALDDVDRICAVIRSGW